MALFFLSFPLRRGDKLFGFFAFFAKSWWFNSSAGCCFITWKTTWYYMMIKLGFDILLLFFFHQYIDNSLLSHFTFISSSFFRTNNNSHLTFFSAIFRIKVYMGFHTSYSIKCVETDSDIEDTLSTPFIARYFITRAKKDWLKKKGENASHPFA